MADDPRPPNPRALHWKRRIDEANERNEPLRVTPEEWEELRQNYKGQTPMLMIGVVGNFLGTPVIVDVPDGR